MDKAGVILAQHQRHQRAAHHGHQGIHGDQARYLVQRLRTHHIEAKPADREHPGTQRQERDAGRRMGRDSAVLAVAVAARAQQDNRRQRNPAAHGVDHNAAGKIMKFFARQVFDPGLHAKVPVPGNAFKKRVNEAHDHRSGN